MSQINFRLKTGDLSMNKKIPMHYFEDEDVLHIVLSEEDEAGSVEISPDITVELNDAGEVIGVEILNASEFLKNAVLESIQGKLLLERTI